MPRPDQPLRKLGFLTIGLFDGADPRPGHESTLRVIELGEQLGFDSAWLRHRHLQYGISSPVAVLAAATQRTSRIELGTAVTPLAWENPLRLAEDLATVDVLSGGRLNPGISVGPPMHWDDVREALYPDTAEVEDFSYARVERLLGFVRGEPAGTFRGTEGIEEWSDRVEPHSPGLAERTWYGGGSLRSAQWAGEHGMNFLTSSVVKAEEDIDFARIQANQISRFRAHHPAGDDARVSQGLVIIPTDSASAEQRAVVLRQRPRRNDQRPLQDRTDQTPAALERSRRPRDRHRRMGRLVQPPPPLRVLRRPHTRRGRSSALPSPPDGGDRRRLKPVSLRTRRGGSSRRRQPATDTPRAASAPRIVARSASPADARSDR